MRCFNSEYSYSKQWRRNLNNRPRPIGTLEERVHAMLDHAQDNDYKINDWPVEDILCDLNAFADLDVDMNDESMRPHVESWIVKRKEQ